MKKTAVWLIGFAALGPVLITPMCAHALDGGAGSGVSSGGSSAGLGGSSLGTSGTGLGSSSTGSSGPSTDSPSNVGSGSGGSLSNSLDSSIPGVGIGNSQLGDSQRAGTLGSGGSLGSQSMSNVPNYNQSTGTADTTIGTPPSGSSTFNGSAVAPFSGTNNGSLNTGSSGATGPGGLQGQQPGMSAGCASGAGCAPRSNPQTPGSVPGH